MDQKKKTILFISFVAVAIILVAIIFYQFIHINTLRSREKDLYDRIYQMEQQIEDMREQMPQA